MRYENLCTIWISVKITSILLGTCSLIPNEVLSFCDDSIMSAQENSGPFLTLHSSKHQSIHCNAFFSFNT